MKRLVPLLLVLAAAPPARAHDRWSWPWGEGRGLLGVQVTPLTRELRTFFAAPADRGVLVGRVQPKSPAESAGLRVGDVLVEIDGSPVRSAWDVRRALAGRTRVTMGVIRDRRRLTLSATLPEPPRGPFRFGPDPWHLPRMPEGFGGDDLRKELDRLRERLRKLERKLEKGRTEPT